MRSVSITEASADFGALVESLQREPATVRRGTDDVAVLLSKRDYDRIRRQNVDDFVSLCDDIAAKAQSRGLTEDKLAELLAD